MTADGTLDMNGFNQQIAGLQTDTNRPAASQYIVNSSSNNDSVLTIAGPGNSIFGGIIADNVPVYGGIFKTHLTVSGGALTLTATNTYSGTTTVSGGALYISSSGSITSSTHWAVGAGAVLAVSNNVAFSAGNIFSVAVSESSAGLLSVTGMVALAGTLEVAGPMVSMKIIESATGITGTFQTNNRPYVIKNGDKEVWTRGSLGTVIMVQ